MLEPLDQHRPLGRGIARPEVTDVLHGRHHPGCDVDGQRRAAVGEGAQRVIEIHAFQPPPATTTTEASISPDSVSTTTPSPEGRTAVIGVSSRTSTPALRARRNLRRDGAVGHADARLFVPQHAVHALQREHGEPLLALARREPLAREPALGHRLRALVDAGAEVQATGLDQERLSGARLQVPPRAERAMAIRT